MLVVCLMYIFLGEKLYALTDATDGQKTAKTQVLKQTQVQKKAQQKKKQKQIKAKQTKIVNNLRTYLNSVTSDGTVSVSFYNLDPVSASKAAKSEDARVYQAGALAVSANADTVETSASTYKLFIIAFLMNQKKQGNFTWTDTNTVGFKNMILYSQNEYAESQLVAYGRDLINQFIEDQGWYSPVFSATDYSKTTALSLTKLLCDLADGTGIFSNESDREFILELMRTQVYRDGIPAGAADALSGTTVADKVGFLNDVNNDAGIVTLPNGQRYILVVMTHGHNQSGFSGFPKIATITKKVQQIVYDGK